MKRFTPASRAATSMLRNPPMLTSLVVMGSLIERGTEPRAASCKTYWHPSTARRQSARLRISPTMRVKRSGYWFISGIRFSI